MPKHVIEALKDFIQSLHDDEPKSPLHVGEVMALWTYLTILDESITFEQMGLNHTMDTVLKKTIEKMMGGASSQSLRLKDFLQGEGVPLPPTSEPRPAADPNAIPPGAKMTDNEIANGASIKLAMAVTACATGVSESIRNDVGAMFFEFQTEAMTYGMLIKTLMRKRGWIKVPPLYTPPGIPSQT